MASSPPLRRALGRLLTPDTDPRLPAGADQVTDPSLPPRVHSLVASLRDASLPPLPPFTQDTSTSLLTPPSPPTSPTSPTAPSSSTFSPDSLPILAIPSIRVFASGPSLLLDVQLVLPSGLTLGEANRVEKAVREKCVKELGGARVREVVVRLVGEGEELE